MGPGRWGSRGDITLGIRVTYADISNTLMLIEIARKKGSYVPDLSFGTHFFQDLVESRIRYLALYPDEEGIIFNEDFFRRSPNVLATLLPEYAYLEHVVRVIDVPQATGGCELQVIMDGERDQALGFLSEPVRQAAPPACEPRPVCPSVHGNGPRGGPSRCGTWSIDHAGGCSWPSQRRCDDMTA
jgi:hypothetical protein